MLRVAFIVILGVSLLGCAAKSAPDQWASQIKTTTPSRVGNYYVGGRVRRPGAYAMGGNRISLRNAILAAGMEGEPARDTRVVLMRRVGEDREQVYDIASSAVFNTSVGTSLLQPDDQLIYGGEGMTHCWGVQQRTIRIP